MRNTLLIFHFVNGKRKCIFPFNANLVTQKGFSLKTLFAFENCLAHFFLKTKRAGRL